jgi:hypothetical protein
MDVKDEVYNDDYSEKDEYMTQFYQDDFLSVFGMERYDDERVNYVLNGVEETVKSCPELKKGLEKIASTMNIDMNFAVVYLFSYCLLKYTHKCLCEYVHGGEIKPEIVNEWYMNIDKFLNESRGIEEDDFSYENYSEEEL